MGQKLKAAIKAQGYSIREFAEKSGLSENVLYNWTSGRVKVPNDQIPYLSKALGQPLAPLSEGDRDSMFRQIHNELHGRQMIDSVARHRYKILGSAGAAVAPIASSEPFFEDWVEFSDQLYHPDRFAISIVGDSMEPRLQHGDVVLVRPSSQAPAGTIVVIRNHNGEYACKVLAIDKGIVIFKPLNPQYNQLDVNEEWAIVGFVIAIRRQTGKRSYIEEADEYGLKP